MKTNEEPLYRHLFENMMEGFAVQQIIVNDAGVSVDYRFIDVNQAFAHGMGLTAADIVGKMAPILKWRIQAVELPR